MDDFDFNPEFISSMEDVVRGNPFNQPNQIHPDLIGAANYYPLANTVSPSRGAMSGGQNGQRLVTICSDPRLIVSGMEDHYGLYTFNIAMRESGKVISIFYKYKQGDIKNSIVLFRSTEKLDKVRYFILDIKTYCSESPTFGFDYKFTENIKKLVVGNTIEKDVVFAHSPNVNYELGYPAYHDARMMNVIMTTDEATGEDSIKASRQALSKYDFHYYQTVEVNVGTTGCLLNLYGDEHTHKAFPDIGETVRDDGILFAIRDISDNTLTPSILSNESIRTPDYIGDRCYNVFPQSEVIEITVTMDENVTSCSPKTEKSQEKHYTARHQLLAGIYRTCKNLEQSAKSYGATLEFSAELQQLLATAYAVVHRNDPPAKGQALPGRDRIINKRSRADRFISITVRSKITPNVAFKFADSHGSKGVIGFDIVDESEMPYDDFGRRAEMIMSTNATINRQNPGRVIEHYLGAVSVKEHNYLKRKVSDWVPGARYTHISLTRQAVNSLTDQQIDELVHHDMTLMGIVCTRIKQIWESGQYPTDKKEHLATRLRMGCVLNLPNDEEREYYDIIMRDIENSVYKPEMSVLNWNRKGKIERGIYPVLIAPMDVLILEKVTFEMNATCQPHRGAEENPAQLSKEQIAMAPVRKQGGRATGEAEVRNIVASCDGAYGEMFDAANSWNTSSRLARAIMTADQPSNMDFGIDREVYPLGKTPILNLPYQILSIFGASFTWKDVK